jgi:glycosyltransferase involved in cell wall biosynthesis
MNDPVKKQVVFISHDSTLTGAPILLLNLISLLKKRNDFDIRIILFKGRILEKDFKKLGQVLILRPGNYNKPKFFLRKLIQISRYRYRLLFLKNFTKNATVVFSNTVTNGKILKAIAFPRTRVVTYVHELESIISVYKKKAALSFKYSDLLIVPAQAVAQNLIRNHSIPEEKIFYLNYFYPADVFYKGIDSKITARKKFDGILHFSDENFYVLGMGAATFRKGIDLFVGAASILKAANKNVHFVWIGDYDDTHLKQKMENEIEDKNLKNVITFPGRLPHSLNNFPAFDLFVLTSREDSYPLVVLEAALAKIPSVIYAKSGGIIDFVKDDCGWVIEETSCEALAKKIIEIKDQKTELKKRGENAFAKCIALHTDEQYIFKQFMNILTAL